MRYVASREEMQNIDAYSINNVGIPGIFGENTDR